MPDLMTAAISLGAKVMTVLLRILSWITGTKTGRCVASFFVSALLLSFVLYSTYKKGRDAERDKQTKKRLENLLEKVRVGDELQGLSVDKRRERISRWVRDNSNN